jgi:hypothetical protein
MEEEIYALVDEAEPFFPAMERLGIALPHEYEDGEIDPWDTLRALIELRQRLAFPLGRKAESPFVGTPTYDSISGRADVWRHGHLSAQVQQLETERAAAGLGEELLPPDPDMTADEWRQELVDEYYASLEYEGIEPPSEALAQLNPISDVSSILAYFSGGQKQRADLRDQVETLLRPGEDASLDLPLDVSTVRELFPREGKELNTWGRGETIIPTLKKRDYFRGVSAPTLSDENLDALSKAKWEEPGGQDRAVLSETAVEYLKGAMGLSLEEADSILTEMRGSAKGRLSKRGARIAMQPSSAVCKQGRSRKLPYRPPRALFDAVGNQAVVILMGIPAERPRVMSWRRGTHIDCDFYGKSPEDLLPLLAKALQSALLWVAEKPGRSSVSSIYVGTVGTGGLYRVWSPGQPLSLNQVAANLARARASGFDITYTDPGGNGSDEAAYRAAYSKIKKTISPPTSYGRKERKQPTSYGRKERKQPSAPRSEVAPLTREEVRKTAEKQLGRKRRAVLEATYAAITGGEVPRFPNRQAIAANLKRLVGGSSRRERAVGRKVEPQVERAPAIEPQATLFSRQPIAEVPPAVEVEPAPPEVGVEVLSDLDFSDDTLDNPEDPYSFMALFNKLRRI